MDGIDDNSFVIDEEVLSRFDTILLFTYAIALFVGGVVGDMFDLRKLLALSYLILGFAYMMLGFGGQFHV